MTPTIDIAATADVAARGLVDNLSVFAYEEDGGIHVSNMTTNDTVRLDLNEPESWPYQLIRHRGAILGSFAGHIVLRIEEKVAGLGPDCLKAVALRALAPHARDVEHIIASAVGESRAEEDVPQ